LQKIKIMGVTEKTKDLGWIQCNCCGNGFEIDRFSVNAGDYINRQSCDHCLEGIMTIDWGYPDGPGWRADK
jgi:hypothetical protein